MACSDLRAIFDEKYYNTEILEGGILEIVRTASKISKIGTSLSACANLLPDQLITRPKPGAFGLQPGQQSYAS